MSRLVEVLNQSLDPGTAREAETQLKASESQPGFPLELLEITSSDQVPLTTRQAAALFFKNLIRRKWTDADGNHLLAASDVVTIKSQIIPLMIRLPPMLQGQLGEAISIMADSDFPDQWEDLVPLLVQTLTPDNPEVNNGALIVAHSIFKRWRPLFRSDALFKEIALVLSQFQQPFLDVLQGTNEKIKAGGLSIPVLSQWLQTMNQLVKIFYDLNCQDIPEFFEDNITRFMEILLYNLKYANPEITDLTEDDESGILEEIKAGICEVLQLYAQRYEGEFTASMPPFVEATWTLLTTIGPASRYDLLVNRALGFLTSVAKLPAQQHLFSSNEVVTQLIEKIVVPNVTMRTSDEELFEDDPIEYIRRDLEGSDSDTRRRAATDFLRELAVHMDSMVTNIVMRYVSEYIALYSQNPSENWRYKNTAAYLFSSIAAKGNVTSAGVSTTNLLIDVVGFFNENIAPDLTNTTAQVHPILQVDAIKFIHNFRNQLTKDQLAQALPLLARLLGSSDYVVYTYAAITIERILSLRQNGEIMFGKQDIINEAQGLIQNLMTLILRNRSTSQKLSENEFLIKCIMRVLVTVQDGSQPYAAKLLPQLINVVEAVSANPSNPTFNHYLFECVGALIRYNGTGMGQEMLDQTVVNPLLQILAQDITEFIPYVLQITAQVLTVSPEQGLPPSFQQLLRPLLFPGLWELRGNIPALVLQLAAILKKGSTYVVATGSVQPLLGVFQKLIASRANDGFGFDLLEYIFYYIPASDLQPFSNDIAQLLLARLQSSRTDKYIARFARLIYFLASANHNGLGPGFSIHFLDQAQNGVFGQVMNAFLLPNTLKISGSVNRKIATVGLSKLILGTTEFLRGKYEVYWAQSLQTVVDLLRSDVAAKTTDVIAEGDIEDVTFGSSFSKLSTTSLPLLDPTAAVADPAKFFKEELQRLESQDQLTIQKHFEGLSFDAKEYLKQAGIV